MKAHLVAVADCAGRLKKTSETTTSVAEAVPAHVTKRRELHHFASTPRMRSMNKSRSERLRKARTPSSCDSFRQRAADRECHLTFLENSFKTRCHAGMRKASPPVGPTGQWYDGCVATRSCVVEFGAKFAAAFRKWGDGRLGNTISRHLTLAVFPGQTLSRRARNRNRSLAEKIQVLLSF